MRTFLTSLIEVSLTMSAVIAVLLLLGRALEKRFAPQWRYWAWLVVALRLCVPVNVSLPRAPVVLPAPPQAAVRVERPVSPAAGAPAVAWNTSPQAGEQGPVYRPGEAPGQTVEVRRFPAEALFFALWCAGAAGFLAVQFGGYLAFRRRAGRWSRPAGEFDGLPVYACDAVPSPLLMGLFRPVILVPAGGAEEFALLHEASHAKRRDLWYKLLLVVCNAVHWFNPLVWVFRRAAARDVEIACDAALLKGKDEDYRRAYGQALLRTVAAVRQPGASLTSAFSGGKRSLRQRFTSLMDMSPKRAGRAALGLLCAAALLSGTMVACGGETGLTVPRNGTVYAKFSTDFLADVSGDHETFTATVVDYDRESGKFNRRDEVNHTFTLAEEVTVHHFTTGGGDTVVAEEPGSLERTQVLTSALLWPMLSSSHTPGSTWLLELHLADGKVDELGWFLHQDQFPKGDIYDEESGLYFCPHTGAGTVVPEVLRGTFSAAHQEGPDGEPGVWFYPSAEQDVTEQIFWMTRTECMMLGGSDEGKQTLFDQWFQADGVQVLNAGYGKVYDPVTGARLTLPEENTGGLILLSARTKAEVIGESGRAVEIDGGSWLVCLHREMLGQISVPQGVSNRSAVFALGLMPEAPEPFWSFSWEGRYPWLELSDGARKQCEALVEAQEDIKASLDLSAAYLMDQAWVTGVEYLDLLPAEDGTVTYENEPFGFTMEFPAEAARHLVAVTTDPGDGWVDLGTATVAADGVGGPEPTPEQAARHEALSDALRAHRAVTFVDRRLMDRLGAGYAREALGGGWSGRVVCVRGEEQLPTNLEELGGSGELLLFYAPTFLTEEGLALAGTPIPEEERKGILQTAREVDGAVQTLRMAGWGAEETRTPLERFAPDGLTAYFDGPNGSGSDINWYRLRLTFHFDGTAGVDLDNNTLTYQLEFEDGSPLWSLVGVTPFDSGVTVEGGADVRSGAVNFTTGNNVVTESLLALTVSRDPACTLRVADPATGESRTFPMEVRFGGETQVDYALGGSYDPNAHTFSYMPVAVDEPGMSYEETGGGRVTAAFAGGVETPGNIQDLLDSKSLYSHAPMGLKITLVGGEIVDLRWVALFSTDTGDAAAAVDAG